ncbi:hypothetical protein NDU88_001956 [Pleurodeles waltl]|uniref:Uncharacterized protein n=1 Tax=Pleurodeles waltl TaxID=8319 RepID=A0AAV7MMD6_PLEWA|nr:hypothetical protein NDU88_001956 [Pleurodeles waltl]
MRGSSRALAPEESAAAVGPRRELYAADVGSGADPASYLADCNIAQLREHDVASLDQPIRIEETGYLDIWVMGDSLQETGSGDEEMCFIMSAGFRYRAVC